MSQQFLRPCGSKRFAIACPQRDIKKAGTRLDACCFYDGMGWEDYSFTSISPSF
jgi:hypothetical protein